MREGRDVLCVGGVHAQTCERAKPSMAAMSSRVSADADDDDGAGGCIALWFASSPPPPPAAAAQSSGWRRLRVEPAELSRLMVGRRSNTGRSGEVRWGRLLLEASIGGTR